MLFHSAVCLFSHPSLKKFTFMKDKLNSSDAKRETPLLSFSLHSPEPADLYFSFSFYEYLTLASCVALCPGSLPLALRSTGAVQDTASSQKYFPKRWSHNVLPAKPRDKLLAFSGWGACQNHAAEPRQQVVRQAEISLRQERKYKGNTKVLRMEKTDCLVGQTKHKENQQNSF